MLGRRAFLRGLLGGAALALGRVFPPLPAVVVEEHIWWAPVQWVKPREGSLAGFTDFVVATEPAYLKGCGEILAEARENTYLFAQLMGVDGGQSVPNPSRLG